MNTNQIRLKATYDKETDAAYIYLQYIEEGQVSETLAYDSLPNVIKGEVNLDFDKNGTFLGIEVLNASKVLPVNIMEKILE